MLAHHCAHDSPSSFANENFFYFAFEHFGERSKQRELRAQYYAQPAQEQADWRVCAVSSVALGHAGASQAQGHAFALTAGETPASQMAFLGPQNHGSRSKEAARPELGPHDPGTRPWTRPNSRIPTRPPPQAGITQACPKDVLEPKEAIRIQLTSFSKPMVKALIELHHVTSLGLRTLQDVTVSRCSRWFLCSSVQDGSCHVQSH